MSTSAAVWRRFTLLFLETPIVGRDALRLLVEIDGDLLVLRVRQPAVPIQHMLAFVLVAIGRGPLYPLGERRIHVTHRVVTARRRHHQIPAQKRERGGAAGFHSRGFTKLGEKRKALHGTNRRCRSQISSPREVGEIHQNPLLRNWRAGVRVRARRSSDVANHVRDPDQDDGTDGRDDDATDQAVGSRNAERPEYPSADKPSDQAEYEIAEQSEACAAEELAGQPARDNSNYDPVKHR